MRWPKRVLVREVGPRDGLQNEKTMISTEAKVEYIESLVRAGVPAVEAASFVHPAAVPQMKDAEEVLAKVRDCRPRVALSALVGNVKGMERAAGAGVPEVVVVVSASEAHNRKNVNRTVAKSLEEVSSICAIASGAGIRVRGAVAMAFGCPFEGETGPDRIAAVVEGMLDAGIAEITLADTAGLGHPRMVYDRVVELAGKYPAVTWGLHFHDTMGLGLANALMGITAGVTVLESSTGGLGGCPFIPGAAGNIATEELVYMLGRMGIETGIDLAGIRLCTKRLEALLGRPLPAKARRLRKHC
ncbi:MAG: hydroxymethylglutaryl-CoA lyase [Firmicutes bacterium]|nr:hydroxymethylglutaryl-CoA lyase [Bacillota bacterium]